VHFEHGREYERAIHYLLLSAQTAGRRFAHRESIELLQHALSLVPKVAAMERTALELRALEQIGDAHYALGAMSESARAYQLAATRAEQAGLAAAHAHALICQGPPFGLIDPDRAVAVVERAVQVSAGTDDKPLQARAQFMAVVLRLLYDTWREADWNTCASLASKVCVPSERCLSEHDEMFYVYVQCLRGKFDEGARAANAKLQETTSLMGYLGAVGARMLALLFLGEFGEVLQIIRQGRRAMAEKNGYDPWLFVFREAWLHTLGFDFVGARLLCESLMRTREDIPPAQLKTIARLASGCIELEHGRYDQAARYFEEIRDCEVTPKFFLHWYWRMQAQLGLTHVWLASGNLTWPVLGFVPTAIVPPFTVKSMPTACSNGPACDP
jgi:tetratricopeptide (TPR) repeat protein